MIKRYEAMKMHAIQDENALLVLKITQKAKAFHVNLLQNESVTHMLLQTSCDMKTSPELLSAMGEIFGWMGKVEQKAQMS